MGLSHPTMNPDLLGIRSVLPPQLWKCSTPRVRAVLLDMFAAECEGRGSLYQKTKFRYGLYEFALLRYGPALCHDRSTRSIDSSDERCLRNFPGTLCAALFHLVGDQARAAVSKLPPTRYFLVERLSLEHH